MNGPLRAHELVALKAPLNRILNMTKAHTAWTMELFNEHKAHQLALAPQLTPRQQKLWDNRKLLGSTNRFFYSYSEDFCSFFLWAAGVAFLLAGFGLAAVALLDATWHLSITCGKVTLVCLGLSSLFVATKAIASRLHDVRLHGPAQWAQTHLMGLREVQALQRVPQWVKDIATDVAGVLPGSVFVLYELKGGDFVLDPGLTGFHRDPATGEILERVLCVWDQDGSPLLPFC